MPNHNLFSFNKKPPGGGFKEKQSGINLPALGVDTVAFADKSDSQRTECYG